MKAVSRDSGIWYAVKMIQVNQVRASTGMTQSDTSGTRSKPDPTMALQKEVKILERLKHPNICQLKEVFYEEHYISEYFLCLGRRATGELNVQQILFSNGYLEAIYLNISSRKAGFVRPLILYLDCGSFLTTS